MARYLTQSNLISFFVKLADVSLVLLGLLIEVRKIRLLQLVDQFDLEHGKSDRQVRYCLEF